MDRIGKEMLATYNYMKREFELRRRRKSGREMLFERATGLGLKMEQYVLGERFVSHIAANRGIEFVNRVVARPEKWITREENAT